MGMRTLASTVKPQLWLLGWEQTREEWEEKQETWLSPGFVAALSRGAGCPSHSPGATGLEARWHHPGHHCGFQTILSLLPKSLGFECHIMRLCHDYRGCCQTIHLSSATCPHDHSPNQDLASGITISGTYPLTTTSQIPSSLSFKFWIQQSIHLLGSPRHWPHHHFTVPHTLMVSPLLYVTVGHSAPLLLCACSADPQCCLNPCHTHSTLAPEQGKTDGREGSRKPVEQCPWAGERMASCTEGMPSTWVENCTHGEGGRLGAGHTSDGCRFGRKRLRMFSYGCFSVNGSEAIKWLWGKERGVRGLRKGATSRVRDRTHVAHPWGCSSSLC